MKKRGLAANTIFFTGALIIQKILSFIYFYALSSSLFPETLGKYVFALSYTSLFSIFIDLGLTPVFIRESSKYSENTSRYLQNVIAVKIPLSFVIAATALFMIHTSGKSNGVIELVYLSAAIMVLDSFTMSFWGVFRSMQNMVYESIATILVQCIIFGLGITALFLTGNIFYIMGALVAASIFNFLFSIALIKWKLRFPLLPKWDKNIFAHFLKIIPLFALGGIFVKLYNVSDSVVLGFLRNETDVGYYAIPAKIITSLAQIIPASFAAALFPVFSKQFSESKEKLKIVFLLSLTYLIIISIPIAGGLLVIIPRIFPLIWPAYTPTISTFMIMVLSIPFIFLSFATGYLLNACDRQKNNTINRGIIAALTILLNIILIPSYGIIGAGITFTAVNILLFILDIHKIPAIIPFRFSDIISILTKCLFACIIMIVAAYLLLEFLHFSFVIALCAILYFSLLLVLKVMPWLDIKKLYRV